VVRRLENFAGVNVALYTQIAANIEPLTTKILAGLVIDSVGKRDAGRNGISDLIDAKKSGIRTAVSSAHESEILRQTDCADLEEALASFQQIAKVSKA
jgi:hypothetical protein